jgi:thioredoxin-like negative regulator of GroEL
MRKITDATYRSEIELNGGHAVIMFTGSWCAPCKTMYPHYESVAQDPEHQHLRYYIADVHECINITSQLMIQAVPALVYLRNGAPRGHRSGALTTSQIRLWLCEMLVLRD